MKLWPSKNETSTDTDSDSNEYPDAKTKDRRSKGTSPEGTKLTWKATRHPKQ